MAEVHPKTLTLAGTAVLVSWCLTIVGVVWAMSGDRAALHSLVQDHSGHIADHETRLRSIEKQTSEMAADVKWIRQALEKREENSHGSKAPDFK